MKKKEEVVVIKSIWSLAYFMSEAQSPEDENCVGCKDSFWKLAGDTASVRYFAKKGDFGFDNDESH